MSAEIRFLASLPPIQSAVKVDGMEGLARIQLDVPGSEFAQVMRLLAECRGKAFEVAISLTDVARQRDDLEG